MFFKIYEPQCLCSPVILQDRQFYIHLLLQSQCCEDCVVISPWTFCLQPPIPIKNSHLWDSGLPWLRLQKVNFYVNILSWSFLTFQNTRRYRGKNLKLILFSILWPEVRSESKTQNYFSAGRSAWLIWGRYLLSFDQIKLQIVWIWTHTNDHLAVFSDSFIHPRKHVHCLGVRATDGFYPQWCHLAPQAQGVTRKRPWPVCPFVCPSVCPGSAPRWQRVARRVPGPCWSPGWGTLRIVSAGWHLRRYLLLLGSRWTQPALWVP